MTRTCKVCKCVQDIENFYLCDKAQGYRLHFCNSCRRNKAKSYQQKNAQVFKEKKKASAKQDYARHKDAYKARARKRRAEKPEEVSRVNKLGYEAFKLKPAYKEYRKRARDKRRSTPQGRLEDSFSCLIRNTVHGKGGRSWEALVDYSRDDLMNRLEKQFQDGMSWENYGKGGWEIDHIVPRCSFHYLSADSEDFKRCWALENLRPLWRRDNLAKAAEDRKLSVRWKNLAKQAEN